MVLAFIHSLRNTLLRTYSMAGILIGAREMEIKRQSPCSLAMTLHTSSSQMLRREAQLTLHHSHDALFFLTEAQLCTFLFYYPDISSSQANQPSLLGLICEIDPYISFSSFIYSALYHSTAGPFQFIYSVSSDRPVGFLQFYSMQ